MNPVYQRRGSLWRIEDQQSLVDTMLNGFDMPKLYLADFTTIKTELNAKNLRFAVVDGKQRLEAIFSFFDNAYPLSKTFVYYDDLNLDLSGLYYKDLVKLIPEVAGRVEEFPMPIMHVVTDDRVKIRELFLRLNKGLVLTGPEKRNAMLGNVPEIIAEIANHEFFSVCTSYQSIRGQHLNTAAKLLAFELRDATTDTKKTTLDSLVEEYADSEAELAVAQSEVIEILDRMTLVFGKKDALLKSAGQIPAYYWFVRGIKLDTVGVARIFLEEFGKRSQGGSAEVLGAGLTENDYSEYRRALRSINDKWSHELRYEMLRRHFTQFLASREKVKEQRI